MKSKHLKRIRKLGEYKFVNDKIIFINHKHQFARQFDSVHSFVEQYVTDFLGTSVWYKFNAKRLKRLNAMAYRAAVAMSIAVILSLASCDSGEQVEEVKTTISGKCKYCDYRLPDGWVLYHSKILNKYAIRCEPCLENWQWMHEYGSGYVFRNNNPTMYSDSCAAKKVFVEDLSETHDLQPINSTNH